MREYIARKEAERATAILEQGVKIGDFVNLTDWFGDIWAEVVDVRIYDQEDMRRFCGVDFIIYGKRGVSRNRDDAYLGRVRKVLSAEQIADAKGVIYSVNGYNDHGHRVEWPTTAGKHTNHRMNGLERYKEWHPDHQPG